jgi:hypothetical protein
LLLFHHTHHTNKCQMPTSKQRRQVQHTAERVWQHGRRGSQRLKAMAGTTATKPVEGRHRPRHGTRRVGVGVGGRLVTQQRSHRWLCPRDVRCGCWQATEAARSTGGVGGTCSHCRLLEPKRGCVFSNKPCESVSTHSREARCSAMQQTMRANHATA